MARTRKYANPVLTAQDRDWQNKPKRSITSIFKTGITEEGMRDETGEVEVHLHTSHDKERKRYTVSLSKVTRFGVVLQHKVHMDGKAHTYATVDVQPTERYSFKALNHLHDMALLRVLYNEDITDPRAPHLLELLPVYTVEASA